jgi:hypothetical protein
MSARHKYTFYLTEILFGYDCCWHAFLYLLLLQIPTLLFVRFCVSFCCATSPSGPNCVGLGRILSDGLGGYWGGEIRGGGMDGGRRKVKIL